MGDEITGQRLLELTCEALLRVHCSGSPGWIFRDFSGVKFVRKTGKNKRKMGTPFWFGGGNPLIFLQKKPSRFGEILFHLARMQVPEVEISHLCKLYV